MKLSYHTPEDVQLSLEGEDQAIVSTGCDDGSNNDVNERGLTIATSEEDTETVELEINFDPPKTPIRITSPDQIPILAGARRNYAIATDVLARFLQQKNEELLRNGKTITKLSLNKVCFPDPDHEQWALATRDLVSLEQITATTCTLDSNLWLEQLAHLPCLQSLEFDHVSRPGSSIVPSLPCLTNFLQNQKKTIKRLVITGLRHTYADSEVSSFFKAIGECTNLQILFCSVCEFQEDQAAFLANLLKCNTELQFLGFHLHNARSTALVARGLAHNRKLQTLTANQDFLCHLGMDDIATVLQAFRETLATQNVHLTCLPILFGVNVNMSRWLGDIEYDQKKVAEMFEDLGAVHFYLDLNRLGRKRFLLGNTGSSCDEEAVAKSKEDWVQVIAENTHNLSVIFYFLQLNPSMYFS